MCEVTLGQEIIGLEDLVNFIHMYGNCYSHQHVLGPFHYLFVDLQKITSLECLEAKVVVFKITIVNNGRIQCFFVLLNYVVVFLADHGHWLFCIFVYIVVEVNHHIFGTRKIIVIKQLKELKNCILTAETLLGLFVQVGYSNPGSQDCIVSMFGSHRGSSLCRQVIQFHSGNTGVQAIDDSECDRNLSKTFLMKFI